MVQDIVEGDGVRVDTSVKLPEPGVKSRSLWQRIRTGWTNKGKEQEKLDPVSESNPDSVAQKAEQENGFTLHEFLTHKFFSSVSELEREAHHLEEVAVKAEAEAYVNLRRLQSEDRSEKYKSIELLESYTLLSDVPSEEEKKLVSSLLLKDVSDMDYPEAVYLQILFNPNSASGGALSWLGTSLASNLRYGHTKRTLEQKRNLEISSIRLSIGDLKNKLRGKGDDFGYKDTTLEALVAKKILIERVRDVEHS